MRLRQITEKIKSREPVRQTGKILADLIDYIQENGQKDEQEAIKYFLSSPNPRSWERIKWVINSAIKTAITDKNLVDRAKQWAGLKTLTSPVASSAVYDMDQKDLRGTPASYIGMSKRLRDNLKYSLGPEGFISMTSGFSPTRPRDVKKILKSIGKSGRALARSAQKDIPNVRPIRKF